MTSSYDTARKAGAARRAGTAVTAALVAALAAIPQATAQHHRCGPAVDRHLQTLGLEAGAVAHTEIIAIVPNREFGTPSEYQAWTSLKSCSGSLVTKLTTSCRVKETYTRGDCQVSGVTRN